MTDFYDQAGRAIAYIDDAATIYSWAGKPLAYIDNGRVFSFPGKLIGWMEDGWIRDRSGNAVLFTPDAIGGPAKPFTQFPPFKGFKGFVPFKGFQEIEPFKPFYTTRWAASPFDPEV